MKINQSKNKKLPDNRVKVNLDINVEGVDYEIHFYSENGIILGNESTGIFANGSYFKIERDVRAAHLVSFSHYLLKII